MIKKYFLFLSLLICFTDSHAQADPVPVARYSFNDGSDRDERSGKKAKLLGVRHTLDRFNNEENAVLLLGNQYSYINLGSDSLLKPKTGAISMWVKMETEIWAGTGHTINPIIITKNSTKDWFYESYCIYYFPETDKLASACTKDSVNQISVYASNPLILNKWHHVVLTFNNDSVKFYLDAKLQGALPKKFENVYLPGDSVLIGSTGNKINERFLQASIDDVEFYDAMLNSAQVTKLFEAPNPNKNKIILNWVYLGLLTLFLITLIFFFVRHRVRLHLKREEKRFQQENLILETELRVNRALMNPHFVFNSLNALQNFILKNENERANNYLVKFSKLIRKILEVNMTDVITLETEIELLNRYLEIEDLRFEEDIKHSMEIDQLMTPSAIFIPIMMLQPFVENAIWHGLLKKSGEKHLTISFSVHETVYLKCVIDDNGVGRKQENKDVFEKRSLATGFVLQRLEILNKLHHLNCTLHIEDKPEASGTRVTILLPILNRLN